MYSDTCGGQNRNINFSTMCLRAVKELPIKSTDHVFMESGHSQMECDSVHSAIEFACRKVDVYCPTDYYRIVQQARARDPYIVHQLDLSEISNYKAMTDAFILNRAYDTEKEKVTWLQMKWLKYTKANPKSIMFRYDYDTEFKTIAVNVSSRGPGGRRRCQKFQGAQCLFTEPPKISLLKYNDLISLCDSFAIPRDYHSFYHNLPHSGQVREALPEPDEEEASDNDS
jgi:hypothetical protein